MQDMFKTIDKKMSTEQNRYSLDILAEFSRYHMYTGHYYNKKKLQHDLHISNTEFTDVMTGEKSVKLSRYHQIFNHIKKDVDKAKKSVQAE